MGYHVCNQEKTLTGHFREDGSPEAVYGVSFSKDSSKALTAGWDNKALLWDISGKKPITTAIFLHSAEVWFVVFSPNEDRVLTAGADSTARIWTLTGTPLYTLTHQSAVYSAIYSHKGDYILTTSDDGNAHLWSAKEPLQAAPIVTFTGHTGVVWTA